MGSKPAARWKMEIRKGTRAKTPTLAKPASMGHPEEFFGIKARPRALG